MSATLYLNAALAGWDAGLSMTLVRQDGSKSPAGKWKRRQTRRCTRRALERIYTRTRRTGVGFATGRVSGHVRLFEFDCRVTFETFLVAAEYTGLREVVARIRAGYEEETPGDGIHWLVRAEVDGGNTELAKRPKRDEEKRHPRDNWQVLIETREDGGFVITAPSSGGVHPTRKPYRLVSGGFDTIATVTPEEWRALRVLAESFDQTPIQAPAPERKPSVVGGRPGEDWAARTDWATILPSAGWTFAYQHGDTAAWWRPGKGRGESISATTNHAGSNLLYVFSTSTDFEARRGYGKFSAYGILHHGGDWSDAARELARLGYGASPSLVQPRVTGPEPVIEATGCPELAEENARLRARLAEVEDELAALKGVLFDAKAYTPTERLIFAADIEDLDQLQQSNKADEEGFARATQGVLAAKVGIKRGNIGKHLAVVRSSAGAVEQRQVEILRTTRNPKTGKSRTFRAKVAEARLAVPKVDAYRAFIESGRVDPKGRGKHGGLRPPICPNHPTAAIVTKHHTTHHCGECDRVLSPEGIYLTEVPPTEAHQVSQVGTPTVSKEPSLVTVSQVGTPKRPRGKDPINGWQECNAGCGQVIRFDGVCSRCDERLGRWGTREDESRAWAEASS